MSAKIIGVSGSPITNSNTDRLIQAVLDASGLEHEFFKLSTMNVKACLACRGCVTDNVCKVKDDFPAIAEKIKQAGAIVVGGYSPYASLDGFTKSFLDRLWSLRHRNGLNKGRLAVAVATGIGRGLPGVDQACETIAGALSMEGMVVLGKLKATGNPECMTCGYGEECNWSALPWVFGEAPKVTEDKFQSVEDQAELWQAAKNLGRQIGQSLASA